MIPRDLHKYYYREFMHFKSLGGGDTPPLKLTCISSGEWFGQSASIPFAESSMAVAMVDGG